MYVVNFTGRALLQDIATGDSAWVAVLKALAIGSLGAGPYLCQCFLATFEIILIPKFSPRFTLGYTETQFAACNDW